MSEEDALRSLLIAATADDVNGMPLGRVEQAVTRQRRAAATVWGVGLASFVALGGVAVAVLGSPTSSVPALGVSGAAVGGAVAAGPVISGPVWSGVTVACLGVVAGAGGLVVLLGVLRRGGALLGRAAAAVAWLLAIAGGVVMGSMLANIATWVPVFGSGPLRAGGWSIPGILVHLGWSRLAGGLVLAAAASLAVTLLDGGMAWSGWGRWGAWLRRVLVVTMAATAGAAAANICQLLAARLVWGTAVARQEGLGVFAGRLGLLLLLAAAAATAGAWRNGSLAAGPAKPLRTAAATVAGLTAATACPLTAVTAALSLSVAGPPSPIHSQGYLLAGGAVAAAALSATCAAVAVHTARDGNRRGAAVATALAAICGAALALPAVPGLPKQLHGAWPTAWQNVILVVTIASLTIGAWAADRARPTPATPPPGPPTDPPLTHTT